MGVRRIVRLGDPVLREAARRVAPRTIGTRRFQGLIDDLFSTMRQADGVGLAAPQVGERLRLFVYAAEPEIEPRVLVNPEITPFRKGARLVVDWEGCLSIPELRGRVPRHAAVRVRGFDREGVPVDFVARGLEARVAQHEVDHLDGIVFLDRMVDFSSLGFSPELDAAEEGEATTPVDGD